MAAVECGLCGWAQEVDEDLPDPVMESLAVKFYSEHMLEIHPTQAHSDGVVREYIRVVAKVTAPGNGQVTKS